MGDSGVDVDGDTEVRGGGSDGLTVHGDIETDFVSEFVDERGDGGSGLVADVEAAEGRLEGALVVVQTEGDNGDNSDYDRGTDE